MRRPGAAKNSEPGWELKQISKRRLILILWSNNADKNSEIQLKAISASKPRWFGSNRFDSFFKESGGKSSSPSPYLSLFGSLECSKIKNSPSLAAVEVFSTGQVTGRVS